MQRRHFVTLWTLSVLLAPHLPALAGRADALPVGTQAGVIVSIDMAQSVIVLRMGRREQRARFGPLTRVRVNASPAAVTDLRPGMTVYVRFASSETGREGTMLVSVDARERVSDL